MSNDNEKARDFTTIDKCLKKVSNRFELAVIVAKRASEIDNASSSAIESKHKSSVVAMLELEEGKLNVAGIKETIITKMQTRHSPDKFEDLDDQSLEAQELIKDVQEHAQEDYLHDQDMSLSEEEMELLEKEDDDIGYKK
jgi:DNA-directed RNA polymerase omega subunit